MKMQEIPQLGLGSVLQLPLLVVSLQVSSAVGPQFPHMEDEDDGSDCTGLWWGQTIYAEVGISVAGRGSVGWGWAGGPLGELAIQTPAFRPLGSGLHYEEE